MAFRNKPKSRPVISDEEKQLVTQETKALINERLTSFINNEDLKEMSFPETFSNLDRKLVHSFAQKFGFKSKSKGKEPNRIITVYKRAVKHLKGILTLKSDSVGTIERLLKYHPVTDEDKEILQHEVASNLSEKSKGSHFSGVRLLAPITSLERTKEFRKCLPIYHYERDLIKTIQEGRVTLVVGETGCGKTTQVPQIIMELTQAMAKKCQIICCVPRRIAAITISERVAYERGEKLGQTVGYQIRLESKVTSDTILTYCTNGVLLRSLLDGDNWLKQVSHIIVDEIHERDKLTDITLIVLKQALAKYRHLKLILMSATVDSDKFIEYFNDCPSVGDVCRVVRISGKTFPISEVYLEDLIEGGQYMSPEMKRMKEELDRIPNENSDELLHGVNGFNGNPEEKLPPSLLVSDEDKKKIDSVLDCALSLGTPEAMRVLVSFFSQNKHLIDYQHSESGMTALMIAAIHGDLKTLEDLVYMDPDVEPLNYDGKTAFDYAEDSGDTELLEWFHSYILFCEQRKETTYSTGCDLSPDVQEMVDIYEKCHIGKDIDENLILTVLKFIHDDGRDGAVLVFLPGYQHIMCVRDKLFQNCHLFADKPLSIHILHSRMKPEEQKKAFATGYNRGERKVILATNIAETSVTVGDVTFVIDCGKVKENSYNNISGSYSLEVCWISRACADQRRGRAGRTREGICFRLYTRKRYKSFQPYKVPELLREPIAELCLQAKELAATGSSIADFLSKAIDPPRPDVIKSAVDQLKEMGALTENEELTQLGRHLLRIPVEPRFGKMIVYATILRCLDPVLTIVCCLTNGEMFNLSMDRESKDKIAQLKLDLSHNSLSDHIVYLNAFRDWETKTAGEASFWCQQNFISFKTMEMIGNIKEQILAHLKQDGPSVNRNSDNWAVVKAAIAAGLYPNIAKVDVRRKCLHTLREMKVLIHGSSVLKHGGGNTGNAKDKQSLKSLPSDFLMFEESHQIRLFSNLRTCTVVSPFTLCIFAGPPQIPQPTQLNKVNDIVEEEQCDTVAIHIDKLIHFEVETKTAKLLHDFRTKCLALVKRSMDNLGNTVSDKDHEATMWALVQVLSDEDLPRLAKNPLKLKYKDVSCSPGQRAQSKQRYQGRGRREFKNRRGPSQNRRECSSSSEGNTNQVQVRGRGSPGGRGMNPQVYTNRRRGRGVHRGGRGTHSGSHAENIHENNHHQRGRGAIGGRGMNPRLMDLTQRNYHQGGGDAEGRWLFNQFWGEHTLGWTYPRTWPDTYANSTGGPLQPSRNPRRGRGQFSASRRNLQ